MLKKVGGIWFVRIGRARFSFCIARKPRAPIVYILGSAYNA